MSAGSLEVFAMANMSLNKNPMPEQEPLVRNKNFEGSGHGLYGGDGH